MYVGLPDGQLVLVVQVIRAGTVPTGGGGEGGGGEVEPPGQESWYALLLERPVSHVPDDEIVYDEVVQEASE